jgi:AhpD family alkylhydroperoxidase
MEGLSGLSPKFTDGLARVHEVTDCDGAMEAGAKALSMAGAAAAKNDVSTMRRELRRAADLGCPRDWACGAAMALLISRGEGAYQRLLDGVHDAYGSSRPDVDIAGVTGRSEVGPRDALEYFSRALGTVPPYVELLASGAPRALEGYFLMREAATLENPLPARLVELFYITVNAAEYMTWNVGVHVRGARKAGATEAEIVEAAICSIPVGGAPAWIAAANAIAEANPA